MAGDDLDDQLSYEFDNVESPSAESIDLEQGPELEPSDNTTATSSDPSKSSVAKPAKKKGPKNPKKKAERQARMQAAVDQKKQLGSLEPAYIADFIAAKIRTEKGDLSAIEIQDIAVPQASIVDTSGFSDDRNLSGLGKFVRKFGCVTDGNFTVTLHISAIRACDASRALRGSLKRPVGKLIPKNKPSVDQDLLSKNPALAVATPGRIRRLLAEKVLETGKITHVVVEAAYIDAKANSVFDLAETALVLGQLAHQGAKIYVY